MLGPDILPTLPGALAQTFQAARLQPAVLQQALRSMTTEQLYASFTDRATAADKQALADPDVRDGILADCVASLHEGGHAMLRDFKLAASDWHFAPEEIGQPVSLWHGTADANVPFATSSTLARRLPRGRLMPLSDQGHLCLFSHWKPILADLLLADPPAS
jgi:pimeloyl-ACP methyl ester carboxylesterase